MRIRYVQTSSRAETLLNKLRDSLLGGVEIAEEKVGEILSILGGMGEEGKAAGHKASVDAAKSAGKAASSAESVARSLSAEAVKASKKVRVPDVAACVWTNTVSGEGGAVNGLG